MHRHLSPPTRCDAGVVAAGSGGTGSIKCLSLAPQEFAPTHFLKHDDDKTEYINYFLEDIFAHHSGIYIVLLVPRYVLLGWGVEAKEIKVCIYVRVRDVLRLHQRAPLWV